MTISRSKQLDLEYQREFALERLETILSESPPLLREKIVWIRNTFQDEWRRSIVSRYQVAVAIRDIYDDVNENNGTVYGARAVEAIKKAFAWDDGVIYQALNVAETFTPQQIEDITQMRLPGGKPLTYSHVVALSRVDDEGQREKLLTSTVKEGWTTRKLNNAVEVVARPEPVKAEERRGRPLARPRDFDAVLDQQAHFAEDFLNRDEQVWSHQDHSLTAKTQDLDTAEFTQERADRLKRHAEQMSQLAQRAKERANEANRVHALFNQVLEQQAARYKQLSGPATAEAGADNGA